jgi:hypothetical protein
MSIVAGGKEQRQIGTAGSNLIFDGERAFIWLGDKAQTGNKLSKGNRTMSSIYVHIFDVNFAGAIFQFDGQNSPYGIEVLPGTEYVYGKNRGQV